MFAKASRRFSGIESRLSCSTKAQSSGPKGYGFGASQSARLYTDGCGSPAAARSNIVPHSVSNLALEIKNVNYLFSFKFTCGSAKIPVMGEGEHPVRPIEIVTDVGQGITRICLENGRFSFGSPNFYLIASGSGAVVFDSGLGSRGEMALFERAWASRGAPRVEAIVLSHYHFDHADGAGKLSRLTGAPILGGEEGGQLPAEIVLGGRKLTVIKTPGHTDDSVCLFDEQSRSLLTGDTVIADPSVIIEGSMTEYLESLARLRLLGASKILPGHGNPVGRPEDQIRRYINRRLEREEQIYGLLQRGMGGVRAIARELYPANIGLGEDQVEKHLEKLEQEGRVARVDGRFVIAGQELHPSIIFPIKREAAYAAYLYISMLPRDAGRMTRLIDQSLARGRSQQLWGWVKETIQNAPEGQRDEFAVMFTMGVLSVEKALLEQSGGLPLPTIIHKDTEEVFHLITGEAINYLAGEQVFKEDSAGDEVDLSFLEIMRPLRDGMTTDEFNSFVLGIAVALGLYIKADDRARGKPSDFRSFPILGVFGIQTT